MLKPLGGLKMAFWFGMEKIPLIRFLKMRLPNILSVRFTTVKCFYWALAIFFFGCALSCSGGLQASDDERTFRIAISAEPPTLDWSLATDNVSFDILINIMEGLTQYNADLESIPAIAKRWEFSKNGKVITYYLGHP